MVTALMRLPMQDIVSQPIISQDALSEELETMDSVVCIVQGRKYGAAEVSGSSVSLTPGKNFVNKVHRPLSS